jgi:ribonuclease HI
VRELRRRLAIWRRELASDKDDALEPVAPKESKKVAEKAKKEKAPRVAEWPELISADQLDINPLPDDGSDVLEIFTDGASRGNPGPASVGVVFRQKGGPDLAEYCEAIGKATNNVAEYKAVVAALEHATRWGVNRVHLFMDSELIVRQLHGVYRVKSPDLRPLFQQAVFFSKQLKEFRVKHVKRAQNAHADALANRALDE